MKILIKEPGKKARTMVVPNKLEVLQQLVDGDIETVTFDDGWTVICNEEGRLRGLPDNCRIFGVSFCGTILFAGTDFETEDFTDCPLTVQDLATLYEVTV